MDKQKQREEDQREREVWWDKSVWCAKQVLTQHPDKSWKERAMIAVDMIPQGARFTGEQLRFWFSATKVGYPPRGNLSVIGNIVQTARKKGLVRDTGQIRHREITSGRGGLTGRGGGLMVLWVRTSRKLETHPLFKVEDEEGAQPDNVIKLEKMA